jgi:hypothetical protein
MDSLTVNEKKLNCQGDERIGRRKWNEEIFQA